LLLAILASFAGGCSNMPEPITAPECLGWQAPEVTEGQILAMSEAEQRDLATHIAWGQQHGCKGA
jgi:hypothetical protein